MRPMTDESQNNSVFWEVPTPEAQVHPHKKRPGEMIRLARHRRRMTQTELANLLGPNRQGKFEYHSTISNIERGVINVPRYRIHDYAHILDLNPQDLYEENRIMGGHGAPPASTVDTLREVYSHLDNPRFCPSCGIKLRS